jgi:hypothetical protein
MKAATGIIGRAGLRLLSTLVSGTMVAGLFCAALAMRGLQKKNPF